MAGGYLNIISNGNNNVILTGEPKTTFFTAKYLKYTNFGMQKFRIDFDGLRDLRLTEPSTFDFKFPRYADLLMDTYVVVTLPDIWSPIYNPSLATNNQWAPYDFRWIRDIGANMISEILITCGSQTLQRYSGEYISAMVNRDFSSEKKELFNKMSGNVPELYDPANAYGRINTYPSAYNTANTVGAEPSIRGRQLYIPTNTWFSLSSKCAFPMIALQYNELHMKITFRPIQHLFVVRDVFDYANNFPYVQPDFNLPQFNMYQFLQTPPPNLSIPNAYQNTTTTWNADIHIIATYCFLSDEERVSFAKEDQVYLVKDVFEYTFQNITGSQKVKLTSNGMVSNWMMYLQRNDVNMRNEWSNYTNWPYHQLPVNVYPANTVGTNVPGTNPNGGGNTGIYITGDFSQQNRKDILETLAIVLNGDYRETVFGRGVFEYVEKYIRTAGSGKDGLYCYNFCLNTDPFVYQPSGAMNMSKFRTVELELTTYRPPIDTGASNFNVIYDQNGVPIGTTKQNWRLFEYNFNMKVFEERYNVLSFIGGNAGMLYAR